MVLVLVAIAVEHGNVAKARELLLLAGQIGGADGWRHVLEGRVALLSSDTSAARQSARQATEAGVDLPEVAGQLGVLFSRTGLHMEAVPYFERAAQARPDDAQIAYNLAIALQFAGDLDQARSAFQALLKTHPDHAQAWLAVVQLDKQEDEARLQMLQQRFAKARDAETRLVFGHAIAKMLEDFGRWDQSLAWLEQAKAGKRAEVRHSRADTDALFAASAATAKIELPESRGDPSPIFITGLPRSGTTLVERIVSAHPQVKPAGELSDFAVLLKRATGTKGPMVLDPVTLHAGISADLSGIEQDYVARLRSITGDCARFIDKMPFNFFFVPLILKALPGAKVICLKRSPQDALFSNFRQLFATGFTYYSYAYDFDDTAHFIASFERLTDIYAEHLPPERFRLQRYEDVVEDLEGQARGLIDFCGLDWDDACLAFHENASPIATASSVQARQPIYSTSVGKWQRYPQGSRRAVEALHAFM